MVAFPYVLSVSKTPNVFASIRDQGVPAKVNIAWLEGAGFKSKNDRAFTNVLKFLGAISTEGVPTDKYRALRQAGWEQQLADMIKDAYKVVFAAFPNANQRPKEDLVNQFKVHAPDASANVIDLMVSTFARLCSIAKFEAAGRGAVESIDQPPKDEVGRGGERRVKDDMTSSTALNVTINLSLELPATDKEEVYDNIFRAMSTHIRDMMALRKPE